MSTTSRRRPKRQSRAEKAEATTEALLAACERLLVTRGFQDASVDEIAAEAGVTKGAVYARYASKEELLLALFERRSIQTLEEATAIWGGELDAEERLAAIEAWQRMDDAGVRMWALLEMELGIASARNRKVARRLGAAQDAGRAHIVAALDAEAKRRKKRWPLPSAELALALEALSVGLTHARLVRPDAVPEGMFSRVARRILDL